MRARSVLHSVAIATLACTAACAKEEAPRRPSVAVNVAQVRSTAIPYTVTTNGIVEPLQSVAIASQVGGTLTRVTFNEGDDVGKGQVLFEIDPRPFQAELARARATLAKDRAQAASAKRDADRYEALAAKDYVTKSQADQSSATAAAAAATVEADEAAVQGAQLNLNNAVIRSPISGKAGNLQVKLGNLVRANSAPPLVVINQLHPILVRFTIPQRQLPELQRYSRGKALSVTVAPSEGSGVEAQGTLSFIDNAVDSTTGTVLLKARFDNANNILWPGQYVTVRLQLYVRENTLVVPSQAVLNGQQGPYVYVVDSAGKAAQRAVSVGPTVDSAVVIDKGVTVHDRVIIDGQSRVSPGSKVVVKTGPGAKPETAAPGRGNATDSTAKKAPPS